jgi:Tol biopolymer transport system component
MKHTLNRIRLGFILLLTLFVVAACSLEASPASNEIPSDALLSEEALIQKHLSAFEAQAVVAANGKIAFSSDADGDFDIYTMNPDGTGLSNITNVLAGNQSQPDWSPNGTKLAFANSSTDDMGITQNAIWVMNADGTNATQLTFFQEGDFIDSNYEANWSPDGAKIAFTTLREGDLDIYIMNADGSNPNNLFVGGEPLVSFADFPPYQGDEYDPSWSPDGTKILYTASRATGTEIATVAVEGASAETEVLLTTGLIGDYSEPEWSPDGQLIAYTLYYVGPELFVMNADGSNQTQVTAENLLSLYSPEFSPDGTLLTFIAYPNEVGSSSDLYSVPAPTAPLPIPAGLSSAALTPAAITTAIRLTTLGGLNSVDWQKKFVNTVALNVRNTSVKGGKGVISSQPSGISCGTQCKTDVAPGTKVTLTATPSTGSKFLTWGGACKGKATTCTVTIDKLRLAIGFFTK